MKRGAWHQLGWHHHKSVKEQLKVNAGVGVILSPRDLSFQNAKDAAIDYKTLGASVLLDPQWHNPEFTNNQLNGYPTCDFRASLSSLRGFSDSALSLFKERLKVENSSLKTDAVIAPAILYEAGKPDIVQVNRQLHLLARDAAAELDIPCYGTVFLGESLTGSAQLIDETLASVKTLECDGWYFAFQFSGDERIPSDSSAVYQCLRAALLLRLTGKPVMHAYAGPMGILSFGAGCDAAASGADQTQWKLSPKRWEEPTKPTGGGPAATRYFSPALWGTIVFPDETVKLSDDLRNEIVTASPFASIPLPQNWSESEATRHLVYSIAKGLEDVAARSSPGTCQDRADEILERAITLHRRIEDECDLVLKDDTSRYQGPWRSALRALVNKHSGDFEFLDLLSS